MYLSKLEILGFKSFANRTSIYLNDGITAIVGPNGCGKTNIVDALRWALGEQRYSTLRSEKMEDVIFNGAKHRKPIGVAEVSLTIQNNKGILPVEYSELTITRRLFRSGESDYMLNRTVCRLKDIVGLFMDTGMGPNAYSVIELKMVESILSEKMEERRRLFEEAAGVTKYKARRKETIRRLADVEADLLRVDDIIAEVAKAVGTLHRQARKAERYNEYQERLRALEIDVLQRDYASVLARLAPLEQRLASAATERDGMLRTVEHDEDGLRDLRRAERDIETELDAARSSLSACLARAGECEQLLGVSQERARALEADAERLEAARDGNARRLAGIDTERGDILLALERAAAELAVADGAFQEGRERHRTLESDVTALRGDARALQGRLLGQVEDISRAQQDLASCTQRDAAIGEQLARVDEEDHALAARLEELRAQHAAAAAGVEELAGAAAAAEREFHAMEERKQQVRGEIDLLQNRAFELQGLLGEKLTRIDFLTGLVERLEGYSESVQHLLRARDWTAATPGTIADAVNTRDEYRVAVEAALGEAAHYILVGDVAEAISGLRALKRNGKGKATFACLNRVPAVQAAPFPVAGDGVVGWAIDLVRFAGEHHDLFQLLLQNVLVVRDEDVATASLREYPRITCVTLEGDVFSSGGLVRGGSRSQDEGSVIGKKDQIAQLNREGEALRRQLEENQRRLEQRNDDYLAIDLRHYADRMKQTQQEHAQREREAAQALFEIDSAAAARRRAAEERAAFAAEREELRRRREILEPELALRQRDRLALEEEAARGAERLRELEQALSADGEQVNVRNVSVVQKRGEIANLENERDRLLRSEQELRAALDRDAAEREEALRTAGALRAEALRTAGELERLRGERAALETAERDIEQRLAATRHGAEDMERRLHEERQRHSQTIASVHETELKVAELQQRLRTLEEHAAETYEITLSREPAGEDDVFDLAQAREEIQDLRAKLKALGLVNPLAFEEWTREKERFDLLTTQRQDLVESRETLTDTIEEINQTAQQKFTETFAQIRENFIRVFKSLFDEGDVADLILEESSDPLEAEISIVARPRGKRPHSIDMLSGGEKTLTAIALLFAIYLVKPSPFCILDEVDAPLDDANIDRFVKIIRAFSHDTQFIVVTHNKRTMAAADTLYGVTMEEEGVSKLVAVDFNSESLSRFTSN